MRVKHQDRKYRLRSTALTHHVRDTQVRHSPQWNLSVHGHMIRWQQGT